MLNQKQSKIVSILILIPLAIAGFWLKNEQDNSNVLKVGSAKIAIELADTPQKRITGLSGRDQLDRDSGLLFIFERDDFYDIWMKDMKFSIDIIWLDSQGIIVGIKENASPETYPESFTSSVPARYVLETNAGWISQNRIKIGDKTENLSALVK